MPDYIGSIAVPEITPSGTFPIVGDFPFGRVQAPEIVVHQFGSANAKIEQRFYLGSGARRHLVRRAALNRTERNTLRDFWEARQGGYGAFNFNAPQEAGGTTAVTARFEREPLAWEQAASGICSVGLVIVEIPTTSPTYTLNSTESRFPGASLKTALLSQVQELIPLITVQPRDQTYSAIYVSDRRCTVGGQLYQARLLGWGGISQSIGGQSDDASFVFGNADRVMRQVSNAVDLWRASVEFALFHVGTGIKLNLWKGEVIDWDMDAGPEFRMSAADGIYELTLPYPDRLVDRNCWKLFNGPACPYASVGSGGSASSCDKGLETPNGCRAHNMQRYFGGIAAQPQGVRIRDNANKGVQITATSIIADSVYGQVIPQIYTDSALPIAAKVIAGRDEGEFYNALGIVGEGPLVAFDFDPLKQLLDNQAPHGPAPLGLRTALGTDPAGVADNFVLGETGASPAAIYAAGTAFAEIRRSDQKGIQPTPLSTHTMQVTVAQGLRGWIWTGAGTRSEQLLTNPFWIAINCMLRARGLRYAAAAVCEQFFDVAAAIAAATICDQSVTKLVGSGSETQFKFRGVLQDQKPLRDWLQEMLMGALGHFTFVFGKLKIGIRINSSTVEAFTEGNILFNSLRLKPVRPTFNHLTGSFADEEFDYVANTVSVYDIDHAQLIGGAAAPLFLKSTMSLVGCVSKSQAARIVSTRLREELGGISLTEQRKARMVSYRTTILALNVEPGMVCSMTQAEMPDGAGEFRVQSWRLNPDYSIDIEGRTTADSMYDLTVGPKPVDVTADAVPAEVTFSTLPVQPWGGNAEVPAASNPLYATTEKLFALGLTYEPLADVGSLAKLLVTGAAPVTSLLPGAGPAVASYSTSTSGGSIPANRYVTVLIYGVDATGRMTQPTTPATVVVGAGGSNSIALNGITWPSGLTGYWVFASSDYRHICRQAVGSGTPSSITLTSIAAVRNYSLPAKSTKLLRVLVSRMKHSGVDGLAVGAAGAGSITVTGAAWSTNEWAGRVVSVISDASDGSAQIWDYVVTSNTADTFTVTGGPLADGVEVDDVLIIRTKVTTSSATTVGDAKWANSTYPAGMTAGDEIGLLIRVIGGLGKGQVRRCVSNTATVHTVDRAWDVVPDSTSVYVVQDSNFSYTADSEVIDNDHPDNRITMSVPVDNLLGQTLMVEVATVDKFGITSNSANNCFREVYLPGSAGTATGGYFEMIPVAGAVTPDLANGFNQSAGLTSDLTVNDPISTGRPIAIGSWLLLRFAQNATGGWRINWGGAFAGITNEQPDPLPNMTSKFQFTTRDGVTWELDFSQKGIS